MTPIADPAMAGPVRAGPEATPAAAPTDALAGEAVAVTEVTADTPHSYVTLEVTTAVLLTVMPKA
jgi:hypothetical protein